MQPVKTGYTNTKFLITGDPVYPQITPVLHSGSSSVEGRLLQKGRATAECMYKSYKPELYMFLCRRLQTVPHQ